MENDMILIGLGSNLSGENHNSPRAVLDAALKKMTDYGILIKRLSRFYESEPVPKSDQPWFVNAVAEVETDLSACGLLQVLHEIEADFGRERRIRWEARIIDLDILAFDDLILPSAGEWQELGKGISDGKDKGGIIIPHPRMHERLFVLLPLMDIDRHWQHPVLKKTTEQFVYEVTQNSKQGLIRPLP